MPRDPRYDVLFEPVRIGPVETRNRFYQVPHCTGLGYYYPNAAARLRGVKAEGGWGVVCTEQAEIHPSSDILHYIEVRLWDDSDIPMHAKMTEAVHAHGSLAGIELCHNGLVGQNFYSRLPPLGPSSVPNLEPHVPSQSKRMDKADIKALLGWQRDAAVRAKTAGFDIVYVYAAHGFALPMHFLCRRFNDRTDEYGGSLENRARLLREMIEVTREAVGDTCALAVRISVDELLGRDGITAEGEGRDVIEHLAELPDLWDVTLSGWENDSQTSRFAEEGFQEPYVAFVKQVTTKPVVGVGRFTSPDAMVAQIRRGVLDLIGAARPSIADPFLPKKIADGRPEDIRECIGCNVCISGDLYGVPMRCTQNPTIGEEWRRDWHPERIQPKRSESAVLVVGAGPAGLECALSLGRRGYAVTLAEATDRLGGRVAMESSLAGLAAWGRVRDHRVHQLQQMVNVEIYLESELSAEQILEFAIPHVVIATGSSWRRDGIGSWHRAPIPGLETMRVLTPEDIAAGAEVQDPVVVYDDDHYYLGGVVAETLAQAGHAVTLVTPNASVSAWTVYTLEQPRIQAHLLDLGVAVEANRTVQKVDDGGVELACVFTGKTSPLPCASLVLVTSRAPNDGLYRALDTQLDALTAAGVRTVEAIGDCVAPGTIAAAVHGGHLFARTFQEDASSPLFRREHPALDSG